MSEPPAKTALKSPKVFISYSHDSLEHCEKVLQLAKALRNQGVDAELDRYHVRPPQGWALWCEEQLRPDVSKFVLVICSDTYLARVENRVPADEGRGVFWEGSLIYSYIYNEKENRRFIPVLLSGSDARDIPLTLRDHTRYHLSAFTFECPSYEALYRELTGQPAVSKPQLGEVVSLPTKYSALIVAPALPMREIKTSFPMPVGGPHSGTGDQTIRGNHDVVVPRSKSFVAREMRKLSLGAGILAVLIIASLWFLSSNESGQALRKTISRKVRDTISEIGRTSSPELAQAKRNRHMTWIAQDFADDPLSILDTLDRAVFYWTNSTTGVTTKLNLVIPFTNHYALLTSLGLPTQTVEIFPKVVDGGGWEKGILRER